MEVHVHPVNDSGDIAVSPNNCAFLLNLNMPIVNFWVVMLHSTEAGPAKLSVLNVTFLNEDALAESAVLCALNSEMLLQFTLNDSGQNKIEELEALYLDRLKVAIEGGVRETVSNTELLN